MNKPYRYNFSKQFIILIQTFVNKYKNYNNYEFNIYWLKWKTDNDIIINNEKDIRISVSELLNRPIKPE